MSPLREVVGTRRTFEVVTAKGEKLSISRRNVTRYAGLRELGLDAALESYVAELEAGTLKAGRCRPVVVFGERFPSVNAARVAHDISKGTHEGIMRRNPRLAIGEALERLVEARAAREARGADPKVAAARARKRAAYRQNPPTKVPGGRIVHPTQRPGYVPDFGRPAWAIAAAIREGK